MLDSVSFHRKRKFHLESRKLTSLRLFTFPMGFFSIIFGPFIKAYNLRKELKNQGNDIFHSKSQALTESRAKMESQITGLNQKRARIENELLENTFNCIQDMSQVSNKINQRAKLMNKLFDDMKDPDIDQQKIYNKLHKIGLIRPGEPVRMENAFLDIIENMKEMQREQSKQDISKSFEEIKMEVLSLKEEGINTSKMLEKDMMAVDQITNVMGQLQKNK